MKQPPDKNDMFYIIYDLIKSASLLLSSESIWKRLAICLLMFYVRDGSYCETQRDYCLGNACENNSTCQSQILNETYACLCDTGFTGRNCEGNINDCVPNPCLNEGACLDGVNSYTCLCASGWSGLNCSEDVDECLVNRMKCKSGSCVNTIGSFECECPANVSGRFCDTDLFDECSLNPCPRNFSCANKLGNYSCACPNGFAGPYCNISISKCSGNPCHHEGTQSCVDGLQNYTCICIDGFTGRWCENEVDECYSRPCTNGGLCVNLVNEYQCACRPDFDGKNCENIANKCSVLEPCQNNGTCVRTGTNWRDYICQCAPGWSGRNCSLEIDECLSNPCRNGATCTDLHNAYNCSCSPGWTGNRCETNIDACALEPCYNNASCIDSLAANVYSCVCLAGFTGIQCETNIDDCKRLGADCNNGICIDLINEYRCQCKSGWFGATCDTERDMCAHDPCFNHVTCENANTSLGYICTCKVGWTGHACTTNIDECVANLCQNGGVCVDHVGTYTCRCPPGFEGNFCEVDVDECASSPCRNGGTCLNLIGQFFCNCIPGFDGVSCEKDVNECASNPCRNNATCLDLTADFSCACLPGFTEKTCSVHLCDLPYACRNGATCIRGIAGRVCSCPAGFLGELCEIEVNECASNPCLHKGSCVDLVNGYKCNCGFPYTGGKCEFHLCQTDVCKNGATCLASSYDYSCLCSAGFTSFNCETEINDCLSFPCSANGTRSCIDLVNNYTCVCHAGYRGRNCELHLCDVLQPCQNNGTCEEHVDDYQCVCQHGFSGRNCSTNDNDCRAGICGSGTCIDLVSDYGCLCQPLTTGRNCEVSLDKCASSPCLNKGACSNIVSIESYSCSCLGGFTGGNCEFHLCDVLDLCVNGSCIPNPDNFSCSCHPGFTGLTCDVQVNECESNPCMNQGNCVDLLNSYSCSCLKNFTGSHCETLLDFCLEQPCLNLGNCSSDFENATFACHCPPAFRGNRCELHECDTWNPCKNNGTCLRNSQSASCACTPGFTSRDCSININECFSQPCLNNGTCFDLVDNYTCLCSSPFSGRNCETLIDYCATLPCLNNATCTSSKHSYSCECPERYTGERCETKISVCDAIRCHDNSRCVETSSGYHCECHFGFFGSRCQDFACPCVNGRCVRYNSSSSYSCTCPRGYVGQFCERFDGDCRNASLKCTSSEFCQSTDYGFVCVCPAHLSGDYCDSIRDCRASPCLNGGNCSGSFTDARCLCPPGYTGQYCQFDLNECLSAPCLNGGSCAEDGLGSYYCHCPQSHVGTRCQISTVNSGTDTAYRTVIDATSPLIQQPSSQDLVYTRYKPSAYEKSSFAAHLSSLFPTPDCFSSSSKVSDYNVFSTSPLDTLPRSVVEETVHFHALSTSVTARSSRNIIRTGYDFPSSWSDGISLWSYSSTLRIASVWGRNSINESYHGFGGTVYSFKEFDSQSVAGDETLSAVTGPSAFLGSLLSDLLFTTPATQSRPVVDSMYVATSGVESFLASGITDRTSSFLKESDLKYSSSGAASQESAFIVESVGDLLTSRSGSSSVMMDQGNDTFFSIASLVSPATHVVVSSYSLRYEPPSDYLLSKLMPTESFSALPFSSIYASERTERRSVSLTWQDSLLKTACTGASCVENSTPASATFEFRTHFSISSHLTHIEHAGTSFWSAQLRSTSISAYIGQELSESKRVASQSSAEATSTIPLSVSLSILDLPHSVSSFPYFDTTLGSLSLTQGGETPPSNRPEFSTLTRGRSAFELSSISMSSSALLITRVSSSLRQVESLTATARADSSSGGAVPETSSLFPVNGVTLETSDVAQSAHSTDSLPSLVLPASLSFFESPSPTASVWTDYPSVMSTWKENGMETAASNGSSREDLASASIVNPTPTSGSAFETAYSVKQLVSSYDVTGLFSITSLPPWQTSNRASSENTIMLIDSSLPTSFVQPQPTASFRFSDSTFPATLRTASDSLSRNSNVSDVQDSAGLISSKPFSTTVLSRYLTTESSVVISEAVIVVAENSLFSPSTSLGRSLSALGMSSGLSQIVLPSKSTISVGTSEPPTTLIPTSRPDVNVTCGDLPCNGQACVDAVDDFRQFRCICPYPLFGPTCLAEAVLHIPRFNGYSYVALGPIALPEKENVILLSFHTTSDTGTLLYADSSAHGDFIQISLISGSVELKFDAGGETVTISSSSHVSTGQLITVIASVDSASGLGSLVVNNDTAISKGSSSSLRKLDLSSSWYLGGMPHGSSAKLQASRVGNFSGCIKDLQVNGKPYKLTDPASVADWLSISDCDVPACSRGACKNNGRCAIDVADVSKFHCACPAGFFGADCSGRLEHCSGDPCGGGTCVWTPDAHFCLCPYGRKGIDCKLSINISKPEFFVFRDYASYMEYPWALTLRDSSERFQIRLQFKIDHGDSEAMKNALLVYAGQSLYGARDDDCLAVGIINGYIYLVFNLGSGLATVRSASRLDANRRWHFLVAGRTRQTGYIYLDGQPKVSGDSPGFLTGLDVYTPLYVGGFPDFSRLPSTVRGFFRRGFQGSVHDAAFRTSGRHFVPLLTEPASGGGENTVGVGVEGGRNVNEDGADDCQSSPCVNGGSCLSTGAGFVCECPSPWKGILCQDKEVPCIDHDPCSSSGQCRADGAKVACDCQFGWSGAYCAKNITVRLPYFKGKSYLALPPVDVRSSFSLRMRFKPHVSSSLLFYVSQNAANNSGDFFAISLWDRLVYVRFYLGSIVSSMRSRERVVIGKWHELYVLRQGKEAIMRIDENPLIGVRASGMATKLDVGSAFYLGGVPDHFSIHVGSVKDSASYRGFVGSIGYLSVNSKLYDLSTASGAVGRNIEDASSSCIEHQCQNMALCEPMAALQGVHNFSCRCPLGWVGELCDKVAPYSTQAWFSESSYFFVQVLNQSSTIQNRFEMNVQTRSDGLLLWFGKLRSSQGDHVALGIRNGILTASFSMAGVEMMRSMVGFNVSDGRTHHIVVERVGRVLTFLVDGMRQETIKLLAVTDLLSTSGHTYLGGFDDDVRVLSGNRFTAGFTGCISAVRLASDASDLNLLSNEDALGGNVKLCNEVGT